MELFVDFLRLFDVTRLQFYTGYSFLSLRYPSPQLPILFARPHAR